MTLSKTLTENKQEEGLMCARYLILISMIAVFAVCSGCGETLHSQRQTMLDRNWGSSCESAKFNQILDPEAGEHLDPVTELEGRAAESVMEKYRKGFKTGAPKKVYNLNLGSIGAIGK